MIAMMIDFRGATREQISRFCEIPGMRRVIYELLYKNRKHDATLAIVGNADDPLASPSDHILSVIDPDKVLPELAINGQANERETEIGC